MKKNSIAVIGRVAKGVELLDGQTVKTKVLCEELRRRFPECQLICVDTYQYRKHFFSILWHMVRAFIECEHIFVLLSRNGRTFFFPILTGMNAMFHRRLYHDVVGGALPEEARERPALRVQLRKFEVNWVELPKMKEELESLGVTNVEVLPNFKRLHILDEKSLPTEWTEPFVFTMFSRVLKEKGMEDAAAAVKTVNSKFGKKKAVLQIYGPVEPGYQEAFDRLLQQYQDCVSYQGCIPYDQSVKALSCSYMLLFPSVYRGEGMPGTIIDAFSAGLPVIATNWHFNGEFVQNGVTGYCYDWEQPELLTEYVIYAIEHPEEIQAMRAECLAAAARYTPDAAMKKICERMMS